MTGDRLRSNARAYFEAIDALRGGNPDVPVTGEVHPVADLFPMLPDDELRSLADDIAARGLLHPVVVDDDGRVLDGRNRLAACRMAGVEPTYATYDGPDPAGYALSVNIARRQMSKGQIAVVAARARAFTGSTIDGVHLVNDVSRGYVGQASTVIDFAPDLADLVLAGSLSLNEAYDEARRRKAAAESAAQLVAKLREHAPDLAALVAEEKLTAAEAYATYQTRERERADQRRDSTRLLTRVIDLVIPAQPERLGEFVTDWAASVDADDDTLRRLDLAIGALTQLRKELR